jgi:hypothetical protein
MRKGNAYVLLVKQGRKFKKENESVNMFLGFISRGQPQHGVALSPNCTGSWVFFTRQESG